MQSISTAGLPVTIHLGAGLHSLEAGPFVFDASAQASEVRLIGSQGAELQIDGHRRRADSVQASSGTAVLSVSPGAPRVSLQGLVLRSSVAIDGSELHIENCTFYGGSLVVGGGEVTATDTQFVGDAIHLSAGGSLVYRLPAPLGHWINSLGQDHLTLQAGVSYVGFPPACSAGLYGDQTTTKAQSSPLCSGLCPPGKICGMATVTPVVCERGGYCPEGSPAARPCPSGRHGNTTGLSSADQCIACPAGTACGVGATDPTPCSPGTFAANGSSAACSSCPESTYQPHGGATECIACGPGYTCPAGSSARIPASCMEGTYLPDDGRAFANQTSCEPCLVGTWCLGGRAAPRLCGVGSFANTTGMGLCRRCSPGTFQEVEGATACKTCPASSWCGEGSSAPTPCPGGTVGLAAGLGDADSCEPCAEGYWCSAGRQIACGLGTYNNATGADDQSFCTYCSPNSFTQGEGKTRVSDCICQEGHYAHWRGDELLCDDCPVGANCSLPGSTIEHLPLEEGHWRDSPNTTDVRRCPGTSSGSACIGCSGDECLEESFTGCKPSTEGPYCALCERIEGQAVYFDRNEMECKQCKSGAAAIPLAVLGGTLLLVSVLSGVVSLLRRRAARHKDEGRDSRIGSLLEKEEKWWKRHAKSIKNRLKIKIKILFTFYQVATKVGETYALTFPKSVERSLEVLSFVNLEIDGLGLPVGCMSLGSFRNKLTFMMLAPVGVLLLTKLIGWCRRDRTEERAVVSRRGSDKSQQLSRRASDEQGAAQSATEAQSAAEASTSRSRRLASALTSRRNSIFDVEKFAVAFKQSSYKALPMALRVTFLAFPTVSSLAFKAFRCDDLDHNDGGLPVGVMRADYAVQCWDEDGEYTAEYQRIRYLAIVAIVLYPVCVPVGYLVLFWKVRDAVWQKRQTPLARSISFLTEEYDTVFFFWELIEVLKKLILVGAMSVVMFGQINQLVIGFIIALCFLVALLVAQPYKRPEDDIIALAAGFCLALFFFFSLILKFQTLTEAVQGSLSGQLETTFAIDNNTNAALLLASTVGALVLGAVMIVIELTAEAAVGRAEGQKMRQLEQELEEERAKNKASEAEAEAMQKVLANAMRQRMIEPSELELSDTKLGAGSFGEVWLAFYRGTPVAVKKLHRNKLDEANLKAFKAECELQLSLRHPNLVQIIGGSWTLEDVNVCLVLELCEKGTLDSLLEREPTRSTLSWAKHKLNIATGVARGMAYLHAQSPPIIHRDLKPDNVLIDDAYNSKLADFGTSREMDMEHTMEMAGTPLYMAPELLRRERYDEKVDLWSFACILECMWTHKKVYVDTLEQGAEWQLRQVLEGRLRPSAPPFLSAVSRLCADFDPTRRCGFARVVEELAAPPLLAAAAELPPGPRDGDGGISNASDAAGGAGSPAGVGFATGACGRRGSCLPSAPALPASASAMPAPRHLPHLRSVLATALASNRVSSQANRAVRENQAFEAAFAGATSSRSGGRDAGFGRFGQGNTCHRPAPAGTPRSKSRTICREPSMEVSMRSERESNLFGWNDDSAPTTDRPGRRVERTRSAQKHARLEREKSGKKLAKFARLGLVLSRGQRAAAAKPAAARPAAARPGPSQTAASATADNRCTLGPALGGFLSSLPGAECNRPGYAEGQANMTVGPALGGFLSNLPGAECSRPGFSDDTTQPSWSGEHGPTELIV